MHTVSEEIDMEKCENKIIFKILVIHFITIRRSSSKKQKTKTNRESSLSVSSVI